MRVIKVTPYLPTSAERQRFVEAPRPGDICALIVPDYVQRGSVQKHQRLLQKKYGGDVTERIGLTCQRFHASEEQLESLKKPLAEIINKTPPIKITSTNLEPFYSTYHEKELLKARVRLSNEVIALTEAIGNELEELTIRPLLPWSSELITLLEGVRVGRLTRLPYAQTLFTAQRLVLTRIKAPGHTTALWSTSFSREVIFTRRRAITNVALSNVALSEKS